jgi:signal transduction histidine kinase
MRYQPFVGKRFQLPSGRVIALGRLMLATLYLLAVLADASQPATTVVVETYALLATYVILAAGIVIVTWSNWWLDAKLAGPAHAMDIVLFIALVLLTEGYTSPFFTFFIFLLLSAAIRWGWRATALTATLLTLLYLIAGLLVVNLNSQFELRPFVVRSGHLVIVSLIVIWFGANQWRARFQWRGEELLATPSGERSPVELALRAAMNGVRAKTGMFVWRADGEAPATALAIRDGELAEIAIPGAAARHSALSTPFLYDFRRDRALKRDAQRNLTEFDVLKGVPAEAATALKLGEGLAIPVRVAEGQGELFLERVPALSTDHIDLGEQISADIATHLQKHALLKAAEESAEGRSRLSLARDLHDSVVQFLAAAAFRLEAMKRSQASGRDLEPELNELKQLMMQEQGELRSFITALRSGPQVAFNDLARDLGALAERLSRQWDIRCEFSAAKAEIMIPTRLHLDALQLTREAVANAVRHADAKWVEIKLAAEPDKLALDFVNDGAPYPAHGERPDMPMSLQERVEQAGGALDMARGMGITKVSISLPIGGGRP